MAPPLESSRGPDLRVPLPIDEGAAASAEESSTGDSDSNPDPGTAGRASASRRAATNASFALLDESRAALEAGDRTAAIGHIERALRLSPREATLWVELGRLQLPDDPGAAQRFARKAIALSDQNTPAYVAAWLLLADAKEQEGDPAAATSIRDRFSRVNG
ncbi:MAG: hypothetical protein AAF648_13020 [Pseudomonadota bacterium]